MDGVFYPQTRQHKKQRTTGKNPAVAKVKGKKRNHLSLQFYFCISFGNTYLPKLSISCLTIKTAAFVNDFTASPLHACSLVATPPFALPLPLLPQQQSFHLLPRLLRSLFRFRRSAVGLKITKLFFCVYFYSHRF